MGRLGNGFAVFMPVTWYHFVVVHTEDVGTRRKLITFLYLVYGCFAGKCIAVKWHSLNLGE